MVAVTPSTTVSQTSVTADTNGNASFPNAGIQVQVTDLVSQQSIAGAGVTLLTQQGAQSGLIVVDPTGQHAPSIFLLGGASGSGAVQSAVGTINHQDTVAIGQNTGTTTTSVSLTAVPYLANDDSTLPVVLTGTEWGVLQSLFPTCETGPLSDVEGFVAQQASEYMTYGYLEPAIEVEGIGILNVVAPEVTVPVEGIFTVKTIGNLTAELRNQYFVSKYTSEGYKLDDQFKFCYASNVLESFFMDHIVFTIAPLEAPSGTPTFGGSVSGKVYDAGSGLAIANSTVSLAGPTTVTTFTDSNGNFTFTSPIAMTSDSYTMSAFQPGYLPGLVQFPLSTAQTYVTNIGLSKPAASPIPSITSLLPSSLLTGSAPQSLAINGTGFLPVSTVMYNAIPHTPIFVSASQLLISLSSSDLSTAGTFQVVVTNPAPNGGPSNSSVFSVTLPLTSVSVSPATATLSTGAVQTFASTVEGGGGVTWSVKEGTVGGAITAMGIYTAPSQAGTYHVVATAVADSSESATATVNVVIGPLITTLHSFDHTKEGSLPWSGLIWGGDGNMYGVTEAGGNLSCSFNTALLGCGTIFKSDTSGNVTVLHSFTGQDGLYPIAPLTQTTGGSLYGTTVFGGVNISDCLINGTSVEAGCGTVFSFDASSGFASIYSFGPFYSSLGAGPFASLVQATNGVLYGTTEVGGIEGCAGTFGTLSQTGCGSIFSINGSNALVSLHQFSGLEGAYPGAALLQGADGNFYGTTGGGGVLTCSSYASVGCGTVYKMTTSGIISTLHAFSETDGAFPSSPLVIGSDGYMYGTTTFGGSSTCTGGAQWQGCGTIFKIDIAGNFTPLHSFSGPDGAYPTALMLATDGYFYGTTQGGGDASCAGRFGQGCGTVFRMDSAGNVTVLYSFTGQSDGSWPESGVEQGPDGNLYGTTAYGGINDDGVIFQISNLTALAAAKAQFEMPQATREPIAPLLMKQPHVGLPGPPVPAQH